MFEKVRQKRPLIHHITNYVTAGDCANMVLAAGASPVMADDPAEAAEMTHLATALVLNLGTLDGRKIESMKRSGKAAADKKIPIILDPVGCGATRFRTETAKMLLAVVHPQVVRGNVSEIAALYDGSARTEGVDAAETDQGRNHQLLAESAAQLWHCVVAVTGPVDVVTDGTRTALIRNGCAMMSCMTGTGCMASSLSAIFCAVHKDYFEAASAALVYMGLCGEEASQNSAGSGSFRSALFDAASNMTGERLQEGAKCDEM